MNEETRRRQRKLHGPGALQENGFPVRQTISYFLNRWLEQSAADVVALIAAETTKVALDAILAHDLDTTRVAVDGSSVLSPNRSPRAKREDTGAGFHGRQGEGSRYGRQLMSVTLTDVPFVVASRISTTPGEAPFMGDELLPELSRRSVELGELACERGLNHPGSTARPCPATAPSTTTRSSRSSTDSAFSLPSTGPTGPMSSSSESAGPLAPPSCLRRWTKRPTSAPLPL